MVWTTSGPSEFRCARRTRKGVDLVAGVRPPDGGVESQHEVHEPESASITFNGLNSNRHARIARRAMGGTVGAYRAPRPPPASGSESKMSLEIQIARKSEPTCTTCPSRAA